MFIQLLALENCQEPDGLCWDTGLGNTEGCFSDLGHGHYNAEQRQRRYSGTTSAQISSPLPIIFLAFTSIHYVSKSSPARLPTPEFRHSVFYSSLSSSSSLPHVFSKYSITVSSPYYFPCIHVYSLCPQIISSQAVNSRIQAFCFLFLSVFLKLPTSCVQ